MPCKRWSKAEMETLRKGWAADLSASQIAEMLPGKTRSAVCGQAWREKLPSRPDRTFAGRSTLAKVKRGSHGGHAFNRVGDRAKRKRVEAQQTDLPPTPIDDQNIPIPQRKKLVELTAETCHWPVGEPASPQFFFCGATTDTEPYCPAHALRALKASEATTLAATP